MRFLRVNMATGVCNFESIPVQYAGLGGRALTSAIVNKEVVPTCSALGPHNKLIFASGLLGGTSCANSGRISVGCKSPMTGGIKESNSGGQPGGYLVKMGILAVIIEGCAKEGTWHKLEVANDSAKLVVADELTGLNNYDCVAKLREVYGDSCGYVSIGRAGEFKLTAASIAFTDRDLRPTRHAGRGGVGAVMGSKGLKAIIINPAGGDLDQNIQNKEAFKEAAARLRKGIMDHPVTSQGLTDYGTAVLLNVMNEAGGLPSYNFKQGTFPGAENVSGEKLHNLTKERGGEGRIHHACMSGCIIRCGGEYPDKKGKRIGDWPEYETIWAFGPNCGIDDLDMIAHYDTLCDDIGVDTIDVGGALALLMEAGVLKFGDAEGVLKLLNEISQGTPLGRIIGSGTNITGKVYGMRRIAVVKGQALPAYDPRAVKGQGVTYATCPMGADHTAGYAVSANILGVGERVDPLLKKGQIKLSRDLQVVTAAIDATGLCLFVVFAVVDNPDAFQAIIDMLNARYGLSLPSDAISSMGKNILESEIDFNRRAGIGPEQDCLPDFFEDEPIAPHNVTFDFTHEELSSTFKW